MEWETSMGHLDKVFQGWEPASAPDFGPPQAALATYLACAKRTEAATQQALQQLCSELGGASAAGEGMGQLERCFSDIKHLQKPLAEHFLVPIQPHNWMVYCRDEEYMKNFVGHFYYMEGHWSVGQELRGLLASSFMNSAAEGDEKENG